MISERLAIGRKEDGPADGSYSALLFSVCNVFVCFSCFLFLKHDQFYQGWTAEHSAEHTTKYFTGFWLFGRFAGHCRGAAVLFRRWRTRRRGKRAGALVKLRQRGLRTPLPSIHLANLRSLPNKTGKLLLLSRTNKDFSNSAALCFTETWLNDAIPDSWSEQIATQNQRGNRAAVGRAFTSMRGGVQM